MGAGGGGPRELNLAGAWGVPSAASVNMSLPVLEIKPRLSKQLSRRPLPATFPNPAWLGLEPPGGWGVGGGDRAQLGRPLPSSPGPQHRWSGPQPPLSSAKAAAPAAPCHPSAAGRAHCPSSPAHRILCPRVTSCRSREQAVPGPSSPGAGLPGGDPGHGRRATPSAPVTSRATLPLDMAGWKILCLGPVL